MTNKTTDKVCRRVNVSFKDNERDNELLSVIKSQNDKSAFIKNCIEYCIKMQDNQLITTNNNNNNSNNNDNNNSKHRKQKVRFKAE